MSDRAPGAGRYARWEREHRFLLREVPVGVGPAVGIADRYLDGTRLRLRRTDGPDGVVHKLGQKVRPDPGDPSAIRITTIYLSPEEHELLSVLGGRTLAKSRHAWHLDGRHLAVDVFEGALQGLVLAEVEVDHEGEQPPPPPGAVADVTHDDRFTGGALAAAADDFVATVVVPLLRR